MKTEHILIMRFSALGDVAMTVPIVKTLAQQYPHIRITVLSRPFARAFFEELAPNVHFMEADLNRDYSGVRGLNRLYRRLTAKQFTAIADFHDVLRSRYLRLRFFMDRYPVAHIDKHRKGRRQLTDPARRRLTSQPTAFENYARVLEKLGYPVRPVFRSIFGEGRGDIGALPDIFRRKGSGEQWIGIAPFAAFDTKVYPMKRLERVVRLLLEGHQDRRIFLFGRGMAENAAMDLLCDRHPECIRVGAHLDNLRAELNLMSHLDVMLSMDSANMHLASLVATPVVSIWGATHPYAGFMGWGQSPELALQTEIDCRPCSIFGDKPCRRGDLACLYGIAPESVAERIESVIKLRQPEKAGGQTL